MLKRLTILLVAGVMIGSILIQPAYALDCVPTEREVEAGRAPFILEATVVAIHYEDGTPYSPSDDWREDAVMMQVEVSRVWRGSASEQDVIRFGDPEWGGVPQIGASTIYYMGRFNSTMSTGNCARIVQASEDERAYLDAIYGEGQEISAGQSEEYLAQIALVEQVTQEAESSVSELLPIAVGPSADESVATGSIGTMTFGLICLLVLLIGGAGAFVLKRHKSNEKLANSDPMN